MVCYLPRLWPRVRPRQWRARIEFAPLWGLRGQVVIHLAAPVYCLPADQRTQTLARGLREAQNSTRVPLAPLIHASAVETRREIGIQSNGLRVSPWTYPRSTVERIDGDRHCHISPFSSTATRQP